MAGVNETGDRRYGNTTQAPQWRRQHELGRDGAHRGNPPPPLRAWSIDQIEAEHRGIKGRLRQWIHRADADDPVFAWLKFCVIRVGRSVLIDEVRFRDSLYQCTAIPASPSRASSRSDDTEAA